MMAIKIKMQGGKTSRQKLSMHHHQQLCINEFNMQLLIAHAHHQEQQPPAHEEDDADRAQVVKVWHSRVKLKSPAVKTL
jgi:hypothetical protein